MPTEGGDKDGESGEESTDETPEERESRHAATLWIMMSLVRGPAVRARSWCWPVVAAASPESCENVCQRRGSSQGVLLPVTDWVRGRTKRMVIAIGGKAPNSSRGARARELDDRFVVNAMYRCEVQQFVSNRSLDPTVSRRHDLVPHRYSPINLAPNLHSVDTAVNSKPQTRRLKPEHVSLCYSNDARATAFLGVTLFHTALRLARLMSMALDIFNAVYASRTCVSHLGLEEDFGLLQFIFIISVVLCCTASERQ